MKHNSVKIQFALTSLLLAQVLFMGRVSFAASEVSYASVQCKGALGSIEAKYADRKLSIQFEKDGIQFKRTFSQDLDTGDFYSSSSAYHGLENPAQWLSISGSTTLKTWIPEHTEHFCTRVDCSQTHTVPGAYQFRLDEWVDLMLNIDAEGHYTFNRIDVTLPELHDTVYNLGADTHCEVEDKVKAVNLEQQ